MPLGRGVVESLQAADAATSATAATIADLRRIGCAPSQAFHSFMILSELLVLR